jgi:hypothetical protein
MKPEEAMRRGVFGAVAVGLALTVVPVAADDAVTITLKEPGTGDRVRVTKTRSGDNKFVATFMGQNQTKDEKRAEKQVYVDEVLARPAGAKKPTKVRRKYESVEVTADGQAKPPSYAGKTLMIEKAGDKYTFTVEGGGELTGDDAKELDREFNKKSAEGLGAKDLLPGKPVKVGESWPLKKDLLVKAFAEEGLAIDPDKTAGTGKLVKAYDKGGKKFGTLEFKIDLPVKGLGPNTALTAKEGSVITLAVTVDCCIDGTDLTDDSRGKVSIKVNASGMGVDLRLTGSETFTEKTEPLPKK